jgi:hypothetical protein
MDRAMTFLDCFAGGVEAQGLAFRSPLDEQPAQKTDRYSHNYQQQPSGICWVQAGDERIGFSLSERNRRVELDESKATLWEKWTSEPTGVLEFSLDRPWGFSLTTTWKDGKKQRLEERVGEMVATLGPLAEFKKCERLRRERDEARQRQLSNLGYQMKIQRKREEEALEMVLKDAELYQRAAVLRRYAVALRAKLLPELKSMTVDSPHDRLLRWIETRAEMMDPLEGAVEERMRGLASRISGLHEN